ncbi:MAG: biopolymer transporter ExbD [Calditrichaeota bacterium]|nr:MAG: biopolymer transporter ExbD [Calditrichota bacterium]
MKLVSEKKKRVLLNITPLIDVLFILIIFFAVSSTFLEQPGIKLDLPKAQKPDLQKVEKAVLVISKDEKLYFRDKPISREQLPELLRKAMEESPDRSLIISADQKVHHGLVVEIMDLARQNGVRKLVISAEPKQ